MGIFRCRFDVPDGLRDVSPDLSAQFDFIADADLKTNERNVFLFRRTARRRGKLYEVDSALGPILKLRESTNALANIEKRLANLDY